MDRWDLLSISGLASAGVGLWLIHPSAALIVVGAVFMFVAWRCAPEAKEKKPQTAEG